MGADWSLERDDNLRRLAKAGLSASEIARHIGGVTRNSVCGRAWRLGVQIGNGERRNARAGGRRKGSGQKLTRLFRAPRLRIVRPLRPREIAQSAEAAQEITASLNLSILEVGFRQCRYATTDDHPFFFCGHPTTGDSSYCAHHHVICTTAPRPRAMERAA
jgi:GcrA cell cycle regulator